MREDHFVGIDHREAARLDALFLRQRQQAVEKLFINLEHLHEFHQTAIGDVQLAVETVSTWIRLNSNFANGREIDRSGELRDVLRLGVARRKRSNTNAFLFRERYAMHFHVFVTAAVGTIQRITALWTKIA